MAGRAGDEDQVRMPGCVFDAGRGAGCIHQQRAAEPRLRRHERLINGPKLALQRQVVRGTPQTARHGRELVGHLVASVVLDVVTAEHARFSWRVAGHDVDAPAPTRYVIEGRAELGY